MYIILLYSVCCRLADLSLEFELEKPPSILDLLSVIVNSEDVTALIHRPVSGVFLWGGGYGLIKPLPEFCLNNGFLKFRQIKPLVI